MVVQVPPAAGAGTLANGAPLPGPASLSAGPAPVRPFAPVALRDGTNGATASGDAATAPAPFAGGHIIASGQIVAAPIPKRWLLSQELPSVALTDLQCVPVTHVDLAHMSQSGNMSKLLFTEWQAPPGEEKPAGIVDWSAVAPAGTSARGSPSPAESGAAELLFTCVYNL